jgi:hypothetical protein
MEAMMPVEIGTVGVAIAAMMKSMETAVTIAAAVNGNATGSESAAVKTATTKTAAMETTAMKATTAEAATMESPAVAATPAAVSNHRRQSIGCVFRRGYRSRTGQRQRLGTLRYSCEREYRRGCDAEAANHAASRTGVVHR